MGKFREFSKDANAKIIESCSVSERRSKFTAVVWRTAAAPPPFNTTTSSRMSFISRWFWVDAGVSFFAIVISLHPRLEFRSGALLYPLHLPRLHRNYGQP